MNFFQSLAESKVDREAGVIAGVSVISVGEAKGHGLFVDATTLEQVKLAAEAHEDGVKVKTDHWSGFNGIVGLIKNFSIDGEKLRGDLHLLENHEAREKVLEMAEKMPSQFGISISFSGEAEAKEVEADGVTREMKFARCEALEACDLVDSPAANKDGLFAAPAPDQFSRTLTELSAQNVTLMAKVEDLTTKLASEEAAHSLTRDALAKADLAYETEVQWRQRLEKFQALSPASVIADAAPDLDAVADDSDEAKLEHYQALTGRERTAYFREHKEALNRAARATAH
jgi:hypothetical protein